MNQDEIRELDIFLAEKLAPIKLDLIKQLEESFESNVVFIKRTKKRILSLKLKLNEIDSAKKHDHFRTKENYEEQLKSEDYRLMNNYEHLGKCIREEEESILRKNKGIRGLVKSIKEIDSFYYSLVSVIETIPSDFKQNYDLDRTLKKTNHYLSKKVNYFRGLKRMQIKEINRELIHIEKIREKVRRWKTELTYMAFHPEYANKIGYKSDKIGLDKLMNNGIAELL